MQAKRSNPEHMSAAGIRVGGLLLSLALLLSCLATGQEG